MQLPTVQASQLIETAQFGWLDRVFQGSIPTELRSDTHQTLALVTEYLSEPTAFGNNQFKGWKIGVEVQIFYKSAADFNTLEAEISLARVFEREDWQIEQSKNHTKDPDTQQVTKVFYFSKKIQLKEAN